MRIKLDRKRKHQKYMVDGVQVPGYSTIGNELSKPYLKTWANSQGLKGIDINKDTEAVDIGTIAHFLIDCKINGNEADLTDYAQVDISKAETAFLAFLEVEKNHKIEYLKNELQLVSPRYMYGGTCDIYAKVDDKLTLIDIKTSKSYYKEYNIQIAAYNQLLIENGYRVEQNYIWRIDKETGSFEEVPIKLTREFDLFLALKCVYQLRKELKI